jgi:hypothetical protein
MPSCGGCSRDLRIGAQRARAAPRHGDRGGGSDQRRAARDGRVVVDRFSGTWLTSGKRSGCSMDSTARSMSRSGHRRCGLGLSTAVISRIVASRNHGKVLNPTKISRPSSSNQNPSGATLLTSTAEVTFPCSEDFILMLSDCASHEAYVVHGGIGCLPIGKGVTAGFLTTIYASSHRRRSGRASRSGEMGYFALSFSKTRSSSSGSGKRIVEFFSTAISASVCR